MTIRFLLLPAFLFLFSLGFSQSTEYKAMCFDYHKHYCDNSENIFYKYNPSSRSALFLKGQTSQTRLEIFNGRDYKISICADEVLGNQIEFKLIDDLNKKVLYDNRNDDLTQEFEFTVTESLEIIIEVTIPGNSLDSGENGKGGIVRRDNAMGCVGVLIEYMITPKKGF